MVAGRPLRPAAGRSPASSATTRSGFDWVEIPEIDFVLRIGFRVDQITVVMLVVRDLRRHAGADLLARLHEGRAALRLVLRRPLALHRLDADAGAGRQLPAALHRLGGRGHLLLPAHRLTTTSAARRPRPRRRRSSRRASATCSCSSASSCSGAKPAPSTCQEIFHMAEEGELRQDLPDVATLFLFGGAVGKSRAVPVPRLAAGRDGGPDARLRADPRRDDGRGRRLPRRAHACPCSRRRTTAPSTSSSPSA